MPGQTTSQFQRWAHMYGEAKENSLSIVYTDTNGKEKTLDITTPTFDLYNLFFNGLQELVDKLHVMPKLNSLILKKHIFIFFGEYRHCR